MASKYHKRTADLIEKARSLGFEVVGTDGRGHVELRHRNGAPYRIAASPGDFRGDRNAIADMERIAGRKLARTAHRRSRKSTRMESSRPSVHERERLSALGLREEGLRARADELREQLAAIIAAGAHPQHIADARVILAEDRAIRDELARMHRPEPPSLTEGIA